MKLPKFKQFLASKIGAIATDLEWNPQDATLLSFDCELKPLVVQRDASGSLTYNWHQKEIDETMVLNDPFSIEIKFDSYNFNYDGISLEKLNELGKAFNTQYIYVKGDGRDYQLGEFTSDHSSEIILTINPKEPHKLLEEYNQWLRGLKDKSDKSLESKKTNKNNI